MHSCIRVLEIEQTRWERELANAKIETQKRTLEEEERTKSVRR